MLFDASDYLKPTCCLNILNLPVSFQDFFSFTYAIIFVILCVQDSNCGLSVIL